MARVDEIIARVTETEKGLNLRSLRDEGRTVVGLPAVLERDPDVPAAMAAVVLHVDVWAQVLNGSGSFRTRTTGSRWKP